MAHRGEAVKHLGGNKYQFRMRVPPALVDVFDKTNWKHTFEAHTPDQARRRGEEWYAHYKSQIAKAKSGAAIYVPPKANNKKLDAAVANAEAFFAFKRDALAKTEAVEATINGDEGELAKAYYQTRKADYDVEAALDAYLAKANIVIPKDSPLYEAALQSYRPAALSELASKIKSAKVQKARAIDTDDLSGFEASVLNVRDTALGEAAPKLSEIYAEFLADKVHHHIRDDKDERAKFDNVIQAFMQCEGDLPVNHKSHSQCFVMNFIPRSIKIPAWASCQHCIWPNLIESHILQTRRSSSQPSQACRSKRPVDHRLAWS